MKIQNNDDVRTMFSIFDQHSLKGPIKLNTTLVWSFQDIRENLIRLRTYEEIRACMDKLDEDLGLADPSSY